MPELLPDIRNAARAFITRGAEVLLLEKDGGGRGRRYALPGGAQDAGESLADALQRECLEEIGTRVAIGELLCVADFFKQKDTSPPTRRHLVEFVFACEVPAGYRPGNGHHPDKHQQGVVWAPVGDLPTLPMSPPYLGRCLPRAPGAPPLYLGRFDETPYS